MRLLLAGYFGMGNLGDDAILEAMVQQLQAAASSGGGLAPAGDEGLSLVALSGQPGETSRNLGIESIGRMDWRAFRKEIRRADAFLLGGGSLFQDATSVRSVAYYAALALLAAWAGCPVVFYAQGVGPLQRRISRRLTAMAAGRAALLSARDAESARLLAELSGRALAQVELAVDPVLAWQEERRLPTADAAAAAPGPGQGYSAAGGGNAGRTGERAGAGPARIGLALRPWAEAGNLVSAVSEAVAPLAREGGWQVVLLPFHAPVDAPLARELRSALVAEGLPKSQIDARWLEKEGPLRLREAAAAVANLDLLLGMRLHSLILAARAAVPALAIEYDPKVRSFARQVGLPSAGPVAELQADGLRQALQQAWNGRASLSQHLREQAPDWQQAAADLAERVLHLAQARQKTTVCRSAAGPLPGEAPPAAEDRVEVLGIPVDRVTQDEAVNRVAAWIREARRPGAGPVEPHLIVTANPEIVLQAQRRPEVARAIRKAALVTADGVGLVWAARQLASGVPERVAGIDLLTALCAAGAGAGWRFYFLGSEPGVAEGAALHLAARYPGLQVCGHHHGYFSSRDEPALLASIREARPDILVAALGAPRQELWLAAHLGELRVPVGIGVGGSLDVLAGKVPRAPELFRRWHLEWLYRLARDPRRWRRGLALPRFVWAVWREKRRRRG